MDKQIQRPVLIVDGFNAYMRSWAAYPQMNSDGEQMGGCIGFLKTLQRLMHEIAPQAVYVAWEGGGSQKRRALYSEYKMNRKPEKLNRFYGDDIPESDANRQFQLMTLLAALKCAPVCQLYVSDCEGDDVIAYLSRGPFKSVPKVIASSDKDLYQLLDDDTQNYNLHKKKCIAVADIIEEFHIPPKNFAIAKALCGDPGDNIPGIKGMGFKTAVKNLPFISSEQDILLEDMFSYCHAHLDESRVYQRIIDNADDVRRNWKLVFLDGSMLSQHQAAKIDHLISTFVPRVDRLGLIRCLVKAGIGDFDSESFFYAFNGIEGLTNKAVED
jgi:5'-3' exonuclease